MSEEELVLALFMYPVSGILKLWHSLVHSVVPENAAWLISLVLLVLTVRGLIAPLNWMSVLAGRRAALMRPEKLELDERKKQASSVAEMKELLKEEQALTKKYNYNPLVGCLPSLIMIPAFLGLYRVILGMAQPQAKDHIGLLNHHDVEAFRATELSNIPLPAYVSMPADTANYLGVTGDDVRSFITPLLIAALVCTVLNMIISQARTYSTLQYDQGVTRRMFYFMIVMTALIPFMLWSAAMTGPVPVAVILYWFCSNLFTLLQTIVFEFILRKRYPLTDAVHDLRRRSRAAFKENKRQAKPSKAEKDAERDRKRTQAKLQGEARKELMAEKRAQKAAAESGSATGSTPAPESTDTASADSIPTDPTATGPDAADPAPTDPAPSSPAAANADAADTTPTDPPQFNSADPSANSSEQTGRHHLRDD